MQKTKHVFGSRVTVLPENCRLGWELESYRYGSWSRLGLDVGAECKLRHRISVPYVYVRRGVSVLARRQGGVVQ